jgi:penicillin-binding protein 1A
MYLNAVQYGDFATGAQAAAENYFQIPASQLDLAQAAMLAGIPRNPNLYSPLTSVPNAKYRQKQVLQRMVQLREITQGEARQAYAQPLTYDTPPPEIRADSAFVDWVYAQLVSMYGQTTASQGGLHVYTSVDPAIQTIAQNAVTSGVSADLAEGHNVHQGALVAIEPSNGEIMAMVGSAFPNGPGGQINYATDVSINPGSSIKLATYAAALQSKKVSMVTPIPDGPITVNMPGFSPGYKPTNYYTDGYPACVVQTCLGNSINVAAVYLELTTGVTSVVDMARGLGAPPLIPDTTGDRQFINGKYSDDAPATDYGPTLTLGGYGQTPLQEADMTATVANGGVFHPATGIVNVTNSAGQLVYGYNPSAVATQALSPQVAYILADIMSNNKNRLTTFGANSPLYFPGRIVAGKTGTYDQFDSAVILGFTPSLASTMWVGNPDNSSMGFGYDTIFSAGPGWHQFMANALTEMKEPGTQWYPVPPGLIKGGNDEYFLPGTSAHTPAPALPSWASISAVTPKSNSGDGNGGTSPTPAKHG